MIGFFDSGSGGLSVLSHFKKLAPEADVVYFGDIENAPYGERSGAELEALTMLGVDILRKRGVAAIVSACNSVSPSILGGASGELPYVEMTTPTARYMKRWQGKKFLLLATPATVESQIYENSLKEVLTLDSVGVPGLAGAIEFGEPDEKIQLLLEEALAPKAGEQYDGVLLGCTHYPLALSIIAPMLEKHFPGAVIIDPGLAVAEDAAGAFETHGTGKLEFLISKENEAFRQKVAALFPGGKYTIEIV